MAQLTKLPGKGTVLQIKLSSVFTDIGQRTKLEGGHELEMIESTDLDSTKKEYLAGIPDGGIYKGTLWYNPNNTVHKTLRDRILTPPATPDEFKLIYPDNSTTTKANEDFFGFLKKFDKTGMEQGSLIQAAFEIQQTGTLTMNDGV